MNLLFAISLVAGIHSGNASRYGYVGDTMDRVGSFACRRTLAAKYGERGWEKMRSHGVAHRTMPCGTRLGICNPRTSLCTVAYVVDRGPWGTLNTKGEWHMRTGKLQSGEYYRGELDLLPGTYSAIALVGIEKVMFWTLDGPSAAAPQVAALTVPEPIKPYAPIPPLRSEPVQLQLAATGAGAGMPALRTAMTGYPTLRLADPAPSRPAPSYPSLRPGDVEPPRAVLAAVLPQTQALGASIPRSAAAFPTLRTAD